jgi:hypothetical protein
MRSWTGQERTDRHRRGDIVELKPGTRFRSQVCETEVVVVKAGDGGALACGGASLVPLDAAPDPAVTMQDGQDGGTLLGKRYTDGASGVELLCVKPGAGTLSIDGRPFELKTAKALPASD